MAVHAVDISYAIPEEQYDRVISTIKRAAQPRDIVLAFDTQVYSVMMVSEIDDFKPDSGSATLFQSVIDWARYNGQNKIVFYSDGYLCDGFLDLENIEAAIVLVGPSPFRKHRLIEVGHIK